jgi:putative Mg2+ transporter-C (MgtC) family protein
MEYFDPLARPFWITVGVALLCGAIVGLERQLRGKPAGVRTSILICLSTSVFIHLGAAVPGGDADPTRVLAQVVTGVGFLGAGVILTREGAVTGVTTAAVIWVLAAIGAAIGLGHYTGAIALSVVTVVILAGIEFLESSVRSMARGIYERDR